MLRPPFERILFSRQVQRACICLPSDGGFQIANFKFEIPRVAARVGLAPTPNGLTGRRATLTPPGNGAAGRIPTCMSPLRRRMPDVFDHGSTVKWSERQDLHLRSPGPKPSVLLLHYALETPSN